MHITRVIGGWPVTFRSAETDEIIDLRHRILRAELPRETAHFDGDEAESTLHVGAFTGGGHCVGCASFMLNEFDGEPAYQLRGMATSEELQSQGVGRELLRVGELMLAERGIMHRLWCNARVPAVGFYERMGWQTVSEPFDIPTAGPHVKMRRDLDLPPTAEFSDGDE